MNRARGGTVTVPLPTAMSGPAVWRPSWSGTLRIHERGTGTGLGANDTRTTYTCTSTSFVRQTSHLDSDVVGTIPVGDSVAVAKTHTACPCPRNMPPYHDIVIVDNGVTPGGREGGISKLESKVPPERLFYDRGHDNNKRLTTMIEHNVSYSDRQLMGPPRVDTCQIGPLLRCQFSWSILPYFQRF